MKRDPLRRAATFLRGPSSPLPHDVGLPLAKWLEAEAESAIGFDTDDMTLVMPAALAVARAILGRPS